MDTVSMLNTMSFYCQPILPLVYDESMSYYETLCKVVGQLNTTGETVNKLNEGLTGEISERQAADAALDARIKEIEETSGKVHFLVFAGANPSAAMPTRDELYNWVRNGDAIYTLFSTNESGRGQVYAASCAYNAGNWGSEASNDFNIIVPIETSYDSANDYAIKQKIAKLTIPSASQTSLNVPWGLEIIEINTPYTSAEGVVNFIATVNDSGAVNASITPSEFLQLYNMTRGGKNLCVAVNAKLAYDGIARSSSVATVDTANRIVRIAFERDSGTAITNGVNQLTKTLDYIIGDAKTGAWVHETIDSKIFDFNRYEGFQFTRGANNVITTDDESTPSAVYSYYSGQSGKLYQSLPTRLVDEVDGAEYWNGVFDSYSDGHITFTFTTANYATIGEKMVVRVIELSSTKAGSVWTGGETWSYAAKEFEVPYSPTAFVLDVWQASDTPTVVNGYVSYDGSSNLDFDDILPLVQNYQDFVATLHKGTSDKGIEWSGLVYSSMLVNDGVGSITFATTEGVTLNNGIRSMSGIVVFSKDSNGAKKVTITFSSALPAPNPDGTDNGKVPTVDGTSWALKTPSGGGSTFADDGAGNIAVDGAAAQSAKRFLQSMTFPGLNFEYLNPMNSGTYSEPYGVKVAGGASLIETVLAMTNPGVYTVYMNRSATDVPEAAAAASSSLRGLMILSQINKHYAIVMLVDQLSNFYVQYIQGDVGGGWKQMPDSSAASDAVLYTAQTLTSPQKLQARKNIDAAGRNSPQFKGYVTLTPATETEGVGVGLSPSKDGNNFALDISDVNEGAPTKLTGVKTPTDADNSAAANVEYVKAKVAGATGGTANAVLYTPQTLTDAQKKQARNNIDALGNVSPVIKDGSLLLEVADSQIQVQVEGDTPSATGEEFVKLNFINVASQATNTEVVLGGLANLGDAEAVGLGDTAVSYAQLVGYTKPLTLTYANSQVTGASYTDIRKAIERGRQIKLAVANTVDIIATNAKNENDKSVLEFVDTGVSGDTVDFTQYSVTAQASGITVNVKSMQLP